MPALTHDGGYNIAFGATAAVSVADRVRLGGAIPGWFQPMQQWASALWRLRQYPVTTMLVSADGRVITGVSRMACGHDPRLVARSYPRKATLTWVNPDTNCNAEAVRSAVVRIRLAAPLGSRPLAHASGGSRIPYFDQRDLARVTVLPAGYRLRGEFPAGQPVGDTRT